MLLFVDRLGSPVSAKESDCPFLRLQKEFVLFLRRFIPVSYTHLDVYKRQEAVMAEVSPAKTIFNTVSVRC